MKESLLREVEMEYAARRAANLAEESRRLAQAAGKDPVIGQLVNERMDLFFTSCREAFARPAEAHAISRSLQERIASLQATLRERLALAGFPPDYLQPVHQCLACRDTGYVGESVRERCACFDRLLRERLIKDTGHGLNLDETFEAYEDAVYSDLPLPGTDGDTQRAFMSRLRARCETYADSFPTAPHRNMLMVGISGLGKTYLMNCIGNRVRERGYEALKLTAYQLTERMRAAVFDRDPHAFSLLLDVPLLLLDDLGAEPVIPNITIEQLFTLLNERGLRGLHTVCSTNLELDEIKERYTERVFSRMADRKNTLLLKFKGKDVRLW